MEELACPQCRMVNPASSAFCSRCGAALGAAVAPPAPASGWDLATAGMTQPPEPVGVGGPVRGTECAGWWQRLGGAFLDWILLALAVGVGAGLYYGIWWALDAEGLEAALDRFVMEEDDWGGMVFWIPILGFVAASVAWEVWWLRSRFMAKPGQWICGFRVVRADDAQPLGTGRSFGRWGAKFGLNAVLGFLYVLISAFTIGLTAKKQSLHDMIAGTACVKRSALAARGIGPDAARSPGAVSPMATPTPPPPPPSTTTPAPPVPPGATGGPFV